MKVSPAHPVPAEKRQMQEVRGCLTPLDGQGFTSPRKWREAVREKNSGEKEILYREKFFGVEKLLHLIVAVYIVGLMNRARPFS
jgi:hypothetical protein